MKTINKHNIENVLKTNKIIAEKHSIDIGGYSGKAGVIVVKYATKDGYILILSHEILHKLGYTHKEITPTMHDEVIAVIDEMLDKKTLTLPSFCSFTNQPT